MSDNKYLKAMQQARAGTTPEPAVPAIPQLPDAPPRKPARTGTRLPGKRSNPDWEQVTLFVRKETKHATLRRLMDMRSGQDLSELVDQLLTRWAKS